MVRREGGQWHMWYLSGLGWLEEAGRQESIYRLMHATSADGIHWQREARPVIPQAVPDECQTSAALLAAEGGHYMLFSYRHGRDFRNARHGYRIGCAYSSDLETWRRDDRLAGIAPAATGWDAQMQCYPYIHAGGDKTYLFYCGNDFGRGGFGYAELASAE